MTNHWFRPRITLFFVMTLILGAGWYTVLHQTQVLTETNIAAYQQTELEIVRAVARDVEQYVLHEIEVHGHTDISELEQEIFDRFIAPIHLLENGDAWIYAPDYVVFDLSEDFPDEYRGKSMAEIFEIQEAKGASHFDEMTADIREAREGVGWYVWLPEKGKEIAAWTPVRVGEYVWIIGLSTPLPEILESTGATEQIRTLNIAMAIGTAVILLILLMWGIGVASRRQAEKFSKESEMRYHRIFNSAPDGVGILDIQGTIIECSQSMVELYGYSQPKELIGKNMTDLLSTDSLKVFQEKIPLLQALKATEGEIQIVRPDGSVVDVWRKGIPLTDVDGSFSGILSYDRDISKRVRMETEVKKLYQAVEQSANAVIITDLDGIIEYANPKFLEVSGYSMEEVLGENPSMLKSGEHSDAYYQNLWETINAGQEWRGELCNKDKDGMLYWEQTSIAPVFNTSGEITNFISIKENITQQIYIERALQKSYRELEKKVEERTGELAKINEVLRIEIIERKQVEEALKASKKFAENIIETANTLIITLNAEANIKTFNKYAEELTGYKKAEVIGKNWFDLFIPQRDKAAIQDIFQEVFKTNLDASQSENYILLKDGQERLISWRNNILLSTLGNISGILSIGMDITERMQAEEALHESETRYRLLAENTSDFVWVTDLGSLALTYASPSVEGMLGFSPDEIISRPLAERLPPDSVKKVWQILEEELAQNISGGDLGRTRVIEAEMIHKYGHTIWIETTARFLYDEEGKPSGLMGAARDITERKKAREKLYESEERYRRLAENARDMIYRMSIPDSRYEYVSQASVDLVGYTPSEFYELPTLIRETIHPDWQEYFEKEWENLIIGNMPPSYEYQIIHKSGEIKWVYQRNVLIRDDSGQPIAIEAIVTDITKRKKMEEKLRQQASTDYLTNIFNRRHFFKVAQAELERSQRYNRSLSVIIFDIDRFKKINDTYGHGVGDEVLRRLTALYQDSLRENDIFARYGGEEFVVLLPETEVEQARQIAERMRKTCAETTLDIGEDTVKPTISFGVSSLGNENLLLDELLLRADRALYASKESGRNRVRVWKKDEHRK